jgi:hypothetical protein
LNFFNIIAWINEIFEVVNCKYKIVRRTWTLIIEICLLKLLYHAALRQFRCQWALPKDPGFCLQPCVYVYIKCMDYVMYACMFLHIYVSMYAMHACMCVYVCMDLCTYVILCMHVFVYMYVCMHACMFVCIHVCTCVLCYNQHLRRTIHMTDFSRSFNISAPQCWRVDQARSELTICFHMPGPRNWSHYHFIPLPES